MSAEAWSAAGGANGASGLDEDRHETGLLGGSPYAVRTRKDDATEPVVNLVGGLLPSGPENELLNQLDISAFLELSVLTAIVWSTVNLRSLLGANCSVTWPFRRSRSMPVNE